MTIFESNNNLVNDDYRWFYVALSRNKNLDNIQFCLDELNGYGFQNIQSKVQGHKSYDKGRKFVVPENACYPDKTWTKEQFRRQNGRCSKCGCGMFKRWTKERRNLQYTYDRLNNNDGHWYIPKDTDNGVVYHTNIVLSCLLCNVTTK